ncbi:AraC family transcriptional regulator [Polymorphobacter arshaanensis]|nr:AraC family transcriptional regulator [Polymorphobacter arshaanensis]
MPQTPSTRVPLVRSAALSGYADLARTLGLDPVRMVAAAGLPLACLHDPDLRIPVPQVGRLLTASAERTQRRDFGLLLAEKRSLANLGPLGLLAREQPTMRQAIATMAPSIAMHNEALSLQVESAGEVSILRIVLQQGEPAQMEQLAELALAATMRMLRRLSDGAFIPESVHFMHRAPADVATHRRLFGVTPRFSQDFDGVVVATRALDAVLPQADPLAAAQLARHLTVWTGGRGRDPVRATQELVTSLLPTGHATIARVASDLGTNRRTLHRQLAAHGTSFTQILDASRRALVETYLADGSRSLTDIAGLLGYASLSAFSRWRHRQPNAEAVSERRSKRGVTSLKNGTL